MKDFLQNLRAIVGDTHVLIDPDTIAGALSEPRGLYQGQTLALVRPNTVEQVSAVVAACTSAGVPIVPQGGNTGLVGGQTPSDGEILLSLNRLNRVREVDADADVMILEAGVTLAQAQSTAEAADRLFPLSLASEGSCTVGGNLATNAGGVAALAHGMTRDLVTGIEVVLSDGQVINLLSKLRKDNTGYDLKHLFIGAEGTLGIITAASLKMFARPPARETAFIGLASPHAALALFRAARASFGTDMTSFELIPRIALDFVLKHTQKARDPLSAPHDWYVLLEVTGANASLLSAAFMEWLEVQIEQGRLDDATIAASGEQRSAFWRLREDISDVQKYEGGSIKHDISVPIGCVPDFLEEATAAVLHRTPGARIVAFGHMGDGNIHFNVSQPLGADTAAFLADWEGMNAVVHTIVEAYHGSYSAEHGIGRLKRDLLAHKKDPAALDVMRRIKAALDPQGLMNPGKVL